MGKVYEEIEPPVADFLRQQKLFFVATAPLAADGRINLSPKGMDTFAVVDAQTVAYLDLTGSGIETVSHLRENGRIVLMFCAFDGPPKIVRLHGLGEVIEPGDEDFDRHRALFGTFPGVRSIVRVSVTRVSDSCGYSVPLFDYVEDRDQLTKWAERKGEAGVDEYQARNNARSIDGLPGLRGR